jgi:hypothetical protein
VESGNGSKLFQLADAPAVKQVKLATLPTVQTPVEVHYGTREQQAQARITQARIAQSRLAARAHVPPPAVPPRQAQPQIQGGTFSPSTASHGFESDFPDAPLRADDRYPLQVPIPHDPVRAALGIDPRALPGYDMSDPQNVLIAELELYGPLERHYAGLGRHETEDASSGAWPW